MATFADIDINFGPKPSQVVRSSLTITPQGLLIKKHSNPPEILTIHAALIGSIKRAKDDPTVLDPNKLFFIQMEYFVSLDAKNQGKKSLGLIQTFNQPNFDLTVKDAHSMSPAAALKVRIAEQLKAISEAAPPIGADGGAPSDAVKGVNTTVPHSTSISTSLPPTQNQPTAAPSGAKPQGKQQQGQAGAGAARQGQNQQQLQIPQLSVVDIIEQFSVEPPPSPTTTSLRISCLQSNIELQKLFDSFVKNDKIVSVNDFWKIHQKTFNKFRAETAQAPIPTAHDVISQMPEFNYGLNGNNGGNNAGSLKQKTTQTVKARAKDISHQLQVTNQAQTKRMADNNLGPTAASLIRSAIKSGVKGEGSNEQNNDQKGQISTTSNPSSSLSTNHPRLSDIRGNLGAQQLLGDEFGWGPVQEHQTRQSIFDPASAKFIEVEDKERFWTVNNVIKGLNLLGQTEVAMTKVVAEQERAKLLGEQGQDLYENVKKILYKDEMTTQLESRVHGNPSGIVTADNAKREAVARIKGDLKSEKIGISINNNANSLNNGPNSPNGSSTSMIKDEMASLMSSNNNNNANNMATNNNNNNLSTTTTTTSTNTPQTPKYGLDLITYNESSFSTSSDLTLICKSKHITDQEDLNRNNNTNSFASLFGLDQFEEGDNGKLFQYKVHQLDTTMVMRTNNNALQNPTIKINKKYIKKLNSGVFSDHNSSKSMPNGPETTKSSQNDAYNTQNGPNGTKNGQNVQNCTSLEELWDAPTAKRQRPNRLNITSAPNDSGIGDWLSDPVAMSGLMGDYDQYQFQNGQNGPNYPQNGQNGSNYDHNDENDENDEELVCLNEINPIANNLDLTIPSSTTTLAILAATANGFAGNSLGSGPMGSNNTNSNNNNSNNTNNPNNNNNNNQNPQHRVFTGAGMVTMNNSNPSRVSTAASDASSHTVALLQRREMMNNYNATATAIPNELIQVLDVTKSLASLYWSTANKKIKAKPGLSGNNNNNMNNMMRLNLHQHQQQQQQLTNALIKQLTQIQEKLTNLSKTYVAKLKNQYSLEQNSHLVALLSIVDYIIDAILQHYKQVIM